MSAAAPRLVQPAQNSYFDWGGVYDFRQPTDFSSIRYSIMIHEILPVGLLQCNCSIFGDEQSREAVVIDPGDAIERSWRF